MSKEMKQRILTSLVLAPIVLGAIYFGGLLFYTLLAFMAVVMAWEWEHMIYRKFTGFGIGIAAAAMVMIPFCVWFWDFLRYIDYKLCALGDGGLCARSVDAFVSIGLPLLMALVYYRLAKHKKKANAGLIAAGVPYILIPVESLTWLMARECAGFQAILFLFVVVWATDIGGYAFGMTIRGPKIFPKISPKKTWAGVFGGIFLAVLTAAAFFTLFISEDEGNMTTIISISVMIAVTAIIGDLFESWVKRRLFIKDSSNILPGHGGLFDRIDGLLFAAPIFALLLFFMGL